MAPAPAATPYQPIARGRAEGERHRDQRKHLRGQQCSGEPLEHPSGRKLRRGDRGRAPSAPVHVGVFSVMAAGVAGYYLSPWLRVTDAVDGRLGAVPTSCPRRYARYPAVVPGPQ